MFMSTLTLWVTVVVLRWHRVGAASQREAGLPPPALPLPLPLPFGVRAAGRASQATGAVRTAVSLSVEATPQGPAPSPLQRIVVTQQCSWTMTTDAYFPKEARYPHFYAVCSH